MKNNTPKLLSAWPDYIGSQQPYAATTIHFLREPSSYQRTDSGAASTVAGIKQQVSDITYRLDQLYFNAKHVVDRVSRDDRFEAFCVVEKVHVHPHVHIAWFLPESRRGARHQKVDELLRLHCILETLHRDPKTLEARDSLLLKSNRWLRLRYESDAIANWKSRGWAVHSSSLEKGFSPGYMFKEMRTYQDVSDRSFFVSELHSSKRRSKMTRYHSTQLNAETGTKTHILNLDAPLMPKR